MIRIVSSGQLSKFFLAFCAWKSLNARCLNAPETSAPNSSGASLGAASRRVSQKGVTQTHSRVPRESNAGMKAKTSVEGKRKFKQTSKKSFQTPVGCREGERKDHLDRTIFHKVFLIQRQPFDDHLVTFAG